MNRQQMSDQLEQVHEWDIVIIGGGATGLGAAVDAASRGYKTLLIEQADFAKGTSSRSTKLIHGGVRYLAQGNIKLVRESLRERGLLLKNAPHVCHNLSFILPSFKYLEKWYYGFGLKFYELLSGKLSLGKTVFLSKKQTQQLLPAITANKLTGSVLYHDGQFDDSRLAINLAQTAVEQGAVVLNYCRLISLTKKNDRISGLMAEDALAHRQYAINCKVVINATGVFTDDIMLMDDVSHKPIITVSQGVHIVVEKELFPATQAMIIPATDDGRVLFAVPWHNKVVIGTTDTSIDNISIEPRALPEEVDFILRNINVYLKTAIQRSAIRTVFAGLRPLINIKGKKSTSLLPRDHTTIVSNSGLVSITGGKWTTYRTMGKSAVDNAVFVSKLPKQLSKTESLPIHGCTNNTDSDEMLAVYGTDAVAIRQLMQQQPSLQKRIHESLPYTKAMVVWAARHEMAMTVEDVLARRTRILFLDAKVAIEAAPIVAALMAAEMDQTMEWQLQQVKDFTAIANQYLID
ncbi:glycerol-3-phosphate dehydrogenase/oxidase [soil metagenome]